MTTIGYPFSLLQGLSDFWTRFFADSPQLEALYKGSAVLVGQAYLDLMSATLGVSLRDAVALDREYYRLLALREDEVRFVAGASAADDRWTYELPDPVVSFRSLDNRVVEPTASLEAQRDFEIAGRVVMFKVDPTDVAGTGLPIDGFARRTLDVAVGGTFVDATVTSWVTVNIRKGDIVRVLDVGTDGAQRRRSDHVVALVRTSALYVDADTALSKPATGLRYAILRVPADAEVRQSLTFVGGVATLSHTRIDEKSFRLYARNSSGADVVEGVDYTINYEAGTLKQWTSGWLSDPGPYEATYTWKLELRFATTGVIKTQAATTRVVQIAAWAPDTLVDRRTLANNFGTLIGREADSSEAYRSFLQGIFQLYLSGPVLQRVESALNVVLGLPVVAEDGETVAALDTTDPMFDRVRTVRTSGQTAVYSFPKGTPLRDDLVAGLVLASFEPLSTAVTVTDYVQTPNWWHGKVIPTELLVAVDGNYPSVARRTASAGFVPHVFGASDLPKYGDPGLYTGADETGFVPAPGHPVFRRRVAFVLMDRYLKYHTFIVTFDIAAVSAANGDAFSRSLEDLNELVIASKPSHTFAFTVPSTFFRDAVSVTETAIRFARLVGSRKTGPDKFVVADAVPTYGAGVWNVGDYWKYELWTASTPFASIGAPVTLAHAPTAPRRRRFVRVHVGGTVGGLRLVENVDYSVDYAAGTVTRLTAWDATTVPVTYRQLNIGNTADAPKGSGDMALQINGVDPAIITAPFDASATQWDGTATPPTAPRDFGLVERALVVNAHP